MLNLNPGLRDISHSITGGAIRAQGTFPERAHLLLLLILVFTGYWMPFECARAVCATFCYRISGALIPLFGPTFPSECIPPNTQHYGRMIINPAIVLQSTREAEEFRRLYGSMPSPPTPSLSSTSPHSSGGHLHMGRSLGYQHSGHRQWRSGTADSDVDGVPHGHYTRLPPLHTHMPTPALSSAESSYSTSTPQSSPRIWAAVNNRSYPQPVPAPAPGQRDWRYGYPQNRYHHLEVDPYRSAVSSSPVSQKQFYHHPLPRPQPKSQPDASSTPWAPARSHNILSPGDKRAYDDYEYDAGESANGSSPEAPSPRVFQKMTPQISLQGQPTHSETRRCSWSAQVASVNHGSDTSKSNGNGSVAELSESDPMSQSSHENVESRRPLPDRDVPSFGGCPRKISSTQTNTRRQNASSYVHTPSSVNDKSGENDSPAVVESNRVPSFSGAERVAALTLLHLGVLGQQDIDDAWRERHGTARGGGRVSDMEVDGYEQERAPASTAHAHSGVGMESDVDMTGSTAVGLEGKGGGGGVLGGNEISLRRGSRERKRRKGRSI